MLIPLEELWKKYKLKIKGVIHIGAHELEEKSIYNELNIFNILWIDVMPFLVEKYSKDNRMLCAAISDKDDEEKTLTITNNIQSSSLFELGTHKQLHPWVHEVATMKVKTKKLDTLLSTNNIDASTFNFFNIDIQGAELLALKGAENTLKYIDYLYLEVNEDEVYKGCALLPELDSFLDEKGYIRVEKKMWDQWGDAFYIRKELIP